MHKHTLMDLAGRWMNRWLGGLVLLACLLTLPAHAAQRSLQFDVFLGYDNFTPEGRWFPIICEIDWDGDPFKATIEVSGGSMGGEQTYREEVEVTGVRKRVLIPVFSNGRYAGTWRVKLLDSRGKSVVPDVEKRPRIQFGFDTPMLAGTPRTASGLPTLPQVRTARPEARPEVARLLPDLFPHNPIAMDGLDVYYINSERAVLLKAPQVEALLSWVRGGGHLIVGVEQGADVNGVPWLKALSPIDFDGNTTVKGGEAIIEWLNKPVENRPSAYNRQVNYNNPYSAQRNPEVESAEFPVATGKLRDGKALISAGDIPLVITAHRGRGKITMMAFSPEREPISSWQDKTKFWARTMDIPTRFFSTGQDNYYYGGQWGIDTVFGAMIESKQIHKPPVHWLLLLLGVYLVVIGPLDQYVLKKINRQMLTWITFPCYVILFSGLIYFIGFMLRSGVREWNELHLVDVLPRGSQAEMHGRSYTAIYSPITARYPVKNEADFSMMRSEYMGIRGNVGGSVDRTKVIQKGNQFEADLNVPVWISKVYANDWWTKSEQPLQATLTGSGNTASLAIQNRLDKKIGPVAVALGDRLYTVGDLNPGESKTVQLSTLRSEMIASVVATQANQFQAAANERMNTFGNNAVSRGLDPAMGSIASSFLSMWTQGQYTPFVYPAGFELSPQLQRGDAIVLAWAPDYSPLKPINKFDAPKLQRNTLLRLVVTPKKT